jgi:hypothetical protein
VKIKTWLIKAVLQYGNLHCGQQIKNTSKSVVDANNYNKMQLALLCVNFLAPQNERNILRLLMRGRGTEIFNDGSTGNDRYAIGYGHTADRPSERDSGQVNLKTRRPADRVN